VNELEQLEKERPELFKGVDLKDRLISYHRTNSNQRMMVLHRDFPKIVTLCGSTRFKDVFNEANLRLTLAGYVVLSVGSFTHSDNELGITEEQKVKLDVLHKNKIDLADCILVLNVDGYAGSSTLSEIKHAVDTNKPTAYLYGLNAPFVKADPVQLVKQLFKEEVHG